MDNPCHIEEAEKLYDDVTDFLIQAGRDVFWEENVQSYTRDKPSWKQHVKYLKDQSREMFLARKSPGMPKHKGPIYDAHIKFKLKCKNAIRLGKRYENQLRRSP